LKVFGATFFQKGSKKILTQSNHKKGTTGSLSEARWYHELDTPQGIKTVVRNAVELVPPTAFMIILQKTRFVNSLFYTIFQQKFRQKRYIIEKITHLGH
jgi:hypothetical protein